MGSRRRVDRRWLATRNSHSQAQISQSSCPRDVQVDYGSISSRAARKPREAGERAMTTDSKIDPFDLESLILSHIQRAVLQRWS
jgi:hypothetical protein